MIDVLFVTLLQTVAGDPQVAEDTANATAPPAATMPVSQGESADETANERMRCRREPIIGTRLTRRICTTPSQDRAVENESRRMLERAQSQMPLNSN